VRRSADIHRAHGRIILFSKSDKQIRQARSLTGVSRIEMAAGLTEAVLVEAAKSLDEAAWEELYRRHAERVYAYLYFRVRDRHIAEDLTADVFVRALAGIGGYVWRGTPLLAWLYRIAHNVAAEYRKKASRTAEHQVPEAPLDIEDQRDHVRMIDGQTDMFNAIRSLTEDQQRVIILRFYHGMSNAEVARTIGKQEGAVKALQSRALRSLGRLLSEPEEVLESA
jgi:RNA polymerase sigma-70 factor (ECF subfamily)